MNITVTIRGTWLTSLTDTSTSVQMITQDRQDTDGITGQVVNYAGRNVGESTSERKRSTPLTAIVVTPDEVAQLREWWTIGAPLLLRDNLGWYRPGVIFGGDVVDLQGTSDVSRRVIKVTMTFADIAWDFSV